MGEIKRAIFIFEEANKIEGEILAKEKGFVYSNLASCYMGAGNLDKSKQAYADAIYYFDQAQLLEEISRCYFYIGVAELRVSQQNLKKSDSQNSL